MKPGISVRASGIQSPIKDLSGALILVSRVQNILEDEGDKGKRFHYVLCISVCIRKRDFTTFYVYLCVCLPCEAAIIPPGHSHASSTTLAKRWWPELKYTEGLEEAEKPKPGLRFRV